jgi:hypothetical protein
MDPGWLVSLVEEVRAARIWSVCLSVCLSVCPGADLFRKIHCVPRLECCLKNLKNLAATIQ